MGAIRGLWLACAVAMGGACTEAPSAYQCGQDSDCDRGYGGQCETDGLCSYADEACPSGRSYSPNSGATAGTCVANLEGVDAGASNDGASDDASSSVDAQAETADAQPDAGNGPLFFRSGERSYYSGSGTTTHTVRLPDLVEAGDTLVVFVTVDLDGASLSLANPGALPSSGWKIDSITTNGSVTGVLIISKIADGSEADGEITFELKHPATEAGYYSFSVAGASDYAFDTATGTGAAPDAPSLSTAWGATESLFVVLAGTEDTSTVASSNAPSGYNNFGYSDLPNCGYMWARRFATVSTEDPGPFGSTGTSDQWVSVTYGFRD